MLARVYLRQVRQNIGRFVAIVLIIALGVGLFTGLRVTRSAMVRTGDKYLSALNFYDFRLISTLGYTEKDVESIAQEPWAEAVEGSKNAHFLAENPNGDDVVLDAYALPEQINRIDLIDGRWPEADDECVIDSDFLFVFPIGSTIRFSAENDEDTLDNFDVYTFTVVGAATSPLFLNMERGSSALGNGKVSAFVYLPEAAFAMDYYTSIYVSVAASGEIYSAQYEAAIDDVRDAVEAAAEARAALRYDEVIHDAREEIADGETELRDGYIEYFEGLAEFERERDDALQELADAKQELDDARVELDDGWAELADAQIELDDGAAALADARADLSEARDELAQKEKDARHELTLARTELVHAARDIADAEKELETYRKEIEKGEKALNDAQAEIDAGMAEYEAGQKMFMDAVASFASQIGAESNTMSAISAMIQQMEQAGYPVDNLWSAYYELSAQQAVLDDAYSTLASAQAELDAQRKTFEEANAQYYTAVADLEDAKRQYAEGKAEYETQKADAEAKFADAHAEIDDAQAEIDRNAAELADAERELADAREELEMHEQDWLDGCAEYDDAYAEAMQELADAEIELADAAAELEDGAAELADAEEELAKLEKAESYTLDREANVGYICFDNDSSIVQAISRVFPLFFFLVAALVCITTMTRMVDEQRTQIGTLKALGFAETSIMFGYIAYALSASLIGCAIGFFAGSVVLPKILWEVYAMLYDFAPIELVFDWKEAAFSITLYLLCAGLATWYACKNELSAVAAELIRPKAPKSGKRIFLERIGFIWNRLKFLHKVSLRNIFRYKSRLFMMTIGIGGCTALLLTGFGINDSITGIVDIQYDQIDYYDLSVSLTKPATQQIREKLEAAGADRIESIAYCYENTIDVLHGDAALKTAQFIVAEDLTGFKGLYNDDGDLDWPSVGEAAISQALAEHFDVAAGDTIILRDSQMTEVELTIACVFTNYVSNYVYITPETYASEFGKTVEFKTAYINLLDSADPHETAAALMDVKETAAVTVQQDMRDRINTMLERLKYIVYVVIVCSGALAFIVLYNLTNINITERLREIATIKVLGFTKKESADYVFRENLLLTLIGGLVGLGMGILLHRYIMAQIKVDMVSFEATIHAASFVISFVMTVIYTIVIDWIMTFKIENIKMAESLKSIE